MFLENESLNSNFFRRAHHLNRDCLDYINVNSPLISNSLSFLFDINKRNEFFKILTNEVCQSVTARTNSVSSLSPTTTTMKNELLDIEANFNNSLNRFIQLYVPLKHMRHLCMEAKLDMITQFLLTNNKTEESKIELIINLANYYAEKQEWKLVLELLDNCTQDNEEFNEFYNKKNNKHNNFELADHCEAQTTTGGGSGSGGAKVFSEQNSNVKFSQKDLYNLYDHACICQAYQEAKTNEKSFLFLYKMKNFLKQIRAIFGLLHAWPIDSCLELIDFCLVKAKLYEQPTNGEKFRIFSKFEMFETRLLNL